MTESVRDTEGIIEGVVHPDFREVGDLLARYTSGDKRFGAAVAVYHQAEKFVDAWGGVRDHDQRPWTHDTTSISFSTTKGVTSTALHVLAERGLVNYDEPVATYWPEFATAGKARVTVRHVLTHQAGLHRINGLVDDADLLRDWDHMVALLAATAPNPEPGTAPGYHGLTYGWLVGEIIRRVSGMPVNDVVTNELAVPLGLDGLSIGVPPEERHRVAPLMPGLRPKQEAKSARMASRMLRFPLTRRTIQALYVPGYDAMMHAPGFRALDAPIPAVNGTFAARSLARLYMMIANGGHLDGVHLLSPERVGEMGRVQVDKRDYVTRLNMQWRLGYHRAFGTGRAGRGAFGHYGFGGSGAFADPDLRLSVAFVTNDLRNGSTPFGDLRMARIAKAARQAALRRTQAAIREG